MENDRALPATRKQAEAVLALVEQKYRAWIYTWPMVDGKLDLDAAQVLVDDVYRPHIVEHWGDDDATVIAWENNSPDSWALDSLTDNSIDPEFGFAVRGAKGSLPAGVYTDAYFSFVLAVYREG